MADLAFHNLYIQGSASILKNLQKSLKVNGVTIVTNPEKAELMLELLNETNEKKILSLSAAGLVTEYEIYLSNKLPYA